ncbi:MAG: DUF5686 family protein [Crocinitomicaceae bacterium]|nr:DUF5686 family protein [Crocinitomicaceae bacterium]
MRKLLSVMIICLWSFFSLGQQVFFVKDVITTESLPFVKVFPNNGSPFLSGIDGDVKLDDQVTSVRLQYTGYLDTTIFLLDVVNQSFWMMPNLEVQKIQEVTVKAKENPAHRIMRHVINNRKKNHPLTKDAFTYRAYSKFVFDVNNEAIESIPENTKDTDLVKLRTFFDSQHLMVMESTSKRTFVPPYRDKEEITAYKVSGFSDPRLSTFASGMQSFSFYDNQFDLLGNNYINPIARGGTKRYLFIMKDTTVVGADTTFTIFYRPRLGKKFDGMTGHLFINTNGYAIEKVIAEPYQDSSGTRVKIVQEYDFIDGKKWFPTKLITEIDMTSLEVISQVKESYLFGRGQTYIDSIQLNPEIKRSFNDNISLSTAEGANELDSADWNEIRRDSITNKERQTYVTIDSLSEEHQFEKRFGILTGLMNGKLPVKKLDLDLERLIDYNEFEGFRFGVGLETSDRLWRSFQVGGYFAWATRDKSWKYGGYSTIHLNRRRGMKLNFQCQEDVVERGGRYLDGNVRGLDNPNLLRDFFVSQKEEQQLFSASFSSDIKANINVKLIGSYQHIRSLDEYVFKPNSNVSVGAEGYRLFETGVEFNWSIGERFMLLGDNKVSQGKKHPTIFIKAIKGWNDVLKGDYDYYRMNLDISQSISLRSLGKFHWKLSASKLIGEVPLFLAFNGNGTGEAWGVSVRNSFETMVNSSFYTTESASLFMRLDFKPIRTKASWNEPSLSLHHAIGFGNFEGRENHSIQFETMDNGYTEAGVVFGGVWTMNFMSLGVGGFYRYGSYADSDWKKNIVPKVAFSLVL